MLFGDTYPIYDATGAVRGTSSDTLHAYYLEQSHGAYTVQGDIKNWVKLDLPSPTMAPTATHGTAPTTSRPRVAGRPRCPPEVRAEQPQFDWSQYDQENPWASPAPTTTSRRLRGSSDLVHAGSDESAGGGAQLSDAIWAHSWAIYENLSGGPGDGAGMMIPGTDGQGPQGKGIWAYNYTINPEDGTPGVFCHEFGHDLGLPTSTTTRAPRATQAAASGRSCPAVPGLVASGASAPSRGR